MNNKLVLILKELKRVSESDYSCIAAKFTDFWCTNVECTNCILSSVSDNPNRYSNQIVLIQVKV